MGARYIYLTDELNNLLKNEPNASGLIQRLLKEYYEKSINPKEHAEELKKQIDLKVEELNNAEKQAEELEQKQQKNKLLVDELLEEEIEEKKARIKQRADEIERECFFDNYLFSEEMDKEALFQEFKKSGERIPVFMKNKGIERRAKKSQFD